MASCRTSLCNGDPAFWIEWKDRDGSFSRERDPACEACAEHVKRYAERKKLTAFLRLVPLEQVKFPF